ncbi:MAG: hypothetical protein SNJ69_10870 [Chloroflexaceae bacterium]
MWHQPAKSCAWLAGHFTWLFWRRNLETAMVVHAAAHVGFFIVNIVTLALKSGAA